MQEQAQKGQATIPDRYVIFITENDVMGKIKPYITYSVMWKPTMEEVYLIKLGKMTLEEIAEATELSLDIVKELESQSIQLV